MVWIPEAPFSSFKNIEASTYIRYPAQWQYRGIAPLKQVGRRKEGLTKLC